MTFRSSLLLVSAVVSACSGDDEATILGALDASLVDAAHGSSDSGPEDSGLSQQDCLPPGRYPRSVTVDATRHVYEVFVPVSRQPRSALLVQLHGGGSTGAAMDVVTGLSGLSEQEGFVVLTPEGWAVNGAGPQVWNAGTCCGPVNSAPDHVAALEAMVAESLSQDACLDPGQVYVTGHSNGGMMSYRLACELSEIFSAIAVSGGALMNFDLSQTPPQQLFACELSRPVSVLHVHGLEDRCAPYQGGPTGGGILMPSVSSVIEEWRSRIQCQPPVETIEGSVQRSLSSCEGGTEVELITVEGLGHPWAGSPIYGNPELCGGRTTDQVFTTEELWRFFQRHRG